MNIFDYLHWSSIEIYLIYQSDLQVEHVANYDEDYYQVEML